MNISDLETKVYKALAHPIRLELVNRLSLGPCCVCELYDNDEYTQPNISQHLKVLRDADIVGSSKEANKIIYSIKHPEVIEILGLVNELVKREIKELSGG